MPPTLPADRRAQISGLRATLLALLAISATAAARHLRPGINPAPVQTGLNAPAESAGDPALDARLTARRDALGLAALPPPIAPAEAAGLRQEVLRGDLPAIHARLSRLAAASPLGPFSYEPFSRVMTGLAAAEIPAALPPLQAPLDRLVAQNPNDAAPLMLRAQLHYALAWAARGKNFNSQTRAEHLQRYIAEITSAAQDAQAAISHDPAWPYAYRLLMRATRDGAQLTAAYYAGIAKFPAYFRLDTFMLDNLQPKWGGSTAAMAEFTGNTATVARAGSPRKMLYLAQYALLASSAYLPCVTYRKDPDRMEACVTGWVASTGGQSLALTVPDSFALYKTLSPQAVTEESATWLIMLADADGAAPLAGRIADMASAAGAGDNAYLTDELAGIYWARHGNLHDAHDKFAAALTEARARAFSSPDAKTDALADLTGRLLNLADSEGNYEDLIVYGQALEALQPSARDIFLPCYAYYQLHRYSTAIAACSAVARGAAEPGARYWRGFAYEARGQIQEAVADFTAVSQSEETWFRRRAALHLSYLLYGLRDFTGSLAELQPAYLYDPRQASKEEIAELHNNRCAALQQLNRLDEALLACDASLRFGSIPQAHSKRNEIIEKLGPDRARQIESAPAPTPGLTGS